MRRTRCLTSVRPVLDELIRAWDGEQVVIRYDHETETWMFVCIHSTARGPAGGGTRMKAYPAPSDGLEEAPADLGG